MDFGTFLDRLWSMFWIVFWLGFTVLLWVGAVKVVIKEGVLEALLMLFVASIFTAAFLAANAVAVLGR
jgi:hypothetical protein